MNNMMDSIDCFLANNFYKDGKNTQNLMPLLYLKTFWQMLIPFFYLILFVISFYLYTKLYKKNISSHRLITTAIFFLFFYMQPEMISTLTSLISCRSIGDSNYILANLTYECNNNQFYFYLFSVVMPWFVLWILIVPSVIFYFLKSH